MEKSIIILASLGLVSSACSNYGSSGQTVQRTAAIHVPAAPVSLTEADIRMIRSYYADTSPGNGRGRKSSLPPGIEKNLQRGKPLPPGIAKQYLPQQLLVRLPRAGDGLEYLVVAGKLLLVEVATQIIREVLLDTVFD
ncbi:MAG: anti-virulence regulator CigR family protein [Gammaproteobacteria bacterium]|nr:anti-virulence regulator CigR family protein [Gammaproteobacteria bacterium]